MRPQKRPLTASAARDHSAVSFDVRIWRIRVIGGARGTRYQARWTVGGEVNYATFATSALARSHEAKLRTASNEGEPFDMATGLPLSMLSNGQTGEDTDGVSWFEFAVGYVDTRWDELSPNSRRSVADALATATLALLATGRGVPSHAELRGALYGWAFNRSRRQSGVPDRPAQVIRWLERNTLPLAELADTDTLRRVLNQLARRLDGQPAGASTVARKRAVLYNLLGYAVEKKHFEFNPLLSVHWRAPKVARPVDRRRVVNDAQGEALLAAVARQGPMGQHLEAFFGCLLHAALRPAEAVILGEDEIQFPGQEGQPGWFHLGGSSPSSGAGWNEAGGRRERRSLKHRSEDETRPVPIAPELAAMLREHIDVFGVAPDGRLFRGERGGLLSDSVYTRVLDAARAEALTPAEARSPLARRPYDLRHACLSRWLNAGIDPALVAEWAGNSVPVLLSTYAKCATGSEQAALKHLGWLKDTVEGARAPTAGKPAAPAATREVPSPCPATDVRPPRGSTDMSWFELAREYGASKSGPLASGSRRAIADALAVVTEALVDCGDAGQPGRAKLRRALERVFDPGRQADLPEDLAAAAEWAERSALRVSAFADADILARVEQRLATKADDRPAAASVVARRRSVLSGALTYAVNRGLLRANPLLFRAAPRG